MAQNNALARTDELDVKLLRDLVMKDASPQQVQLLVHVCDRYGFDPLLKHVVLIKGTLYVTRDGLLDNAHRSGRFDGINVTAERDSDGKWSATATVYVKDMRHPVSYTAYQPEHESNTPAWQKSPRAMTVKCAEVMALKRAFNVSLGTAEEMGHDDPAPVEWQMQSTHDPQDATVDTAGRVVTGDGEIVGQLQRQMHGPLHEQLDEIPDPETAHKLIMERLALATLMDTGGIQIDIKAWGMAKDPEIRAAYNARLRELQEADATSSSQPELIEV